MQACRRNLRSGLSSWQNMTHFARNRRHAGTQGGPPMSASQGRGKMPVTVLSGFLGAGKTTLLQRVLRTGGADNQLGLIVNDMASVNIDSKLIRQQAVHIGKKTQTSGPESIYAEESGPVSLVDTLELQNGCVCCTLAEDLVSSVKKLIDIADQRGRQYDHIVVECSGIAEPRRIRDMFQDAEGSGDAVMSRVRLDTLITVVDAVDFFRLFGSASENFYGNTRLAVPEGSSKENIEMLHSDGVGERRVTELLLEQVECADIVLVNKCDLLENPAQAEAVAQVIGNINRTARVYKCVRAELDAVARLLGSARGQGVASMGILQEHRRQMASIESAQHDHEYEHEHEQKHHHDHGHTHACDKDHIHDHTCNHNHHHHHHHDHEHHHDHHDKHHHEPKEGLVANRPRVAPVHVTETETTAKVRFGITSFVYRRRRPFHPVRFSNFLQTIGSVSVSGMDDVERELFGQAHARNLQANTNTTGAAQRKQANGKASSEFSGEPKLLRSKGFIWMATSRAAAYFISHAGQFLELAVLGKWWADIDKSDWPESSVEEIEADFFIPHEAGVGDTGAGDARERKWEFGDRRQELVFIMSNAGSSADRLEAVLDTCLLTDAELELFRSTAPKGDAALRKLWYGDGEHAS